MMTPMAAGSRPGTSLTAGESRRGRFVGLSGPPVPFSLISKTAMKMAVQIAEEWTVGPLVASHLTTGDDDCLIKPFFPSKLPYQHITPFLSEIDSVREPFFLEFSAIVETDIQGGAEIVASPDFESEFKEAFERRRPTKRPATKPVADEEVRGLFQKFIERRRYVRGDRIGKPISKFVKFAGEEMCEVEPASWRLLDMSSRTVDCFYFSRPGARELFKATFNPPTVRGGMAISLSQLAMMDVSSSMKEAETAAKSRGFQKNVLAVASEIAESIESLGKAPCQCCWTVDIGGLDDGNVMDEGEEGNPQEEQRAEQEWEDQDDDGRGTIGHREEKVEDSGGEDGGTDDHADDNKTGDAEKGEEGNEEKK